MYKEITKKLQLNACFYLTFETLKGFMNSFSILKDEERLVDELASRLVQNAEPVKHFLQLDGMELRETNKNVFTERLTAYRLVGEELTELDAIPIEFNDRSCYVICWNYRIEREGRVVF